MTCCTFRVGDDVFHIDAGWKRVKANTDGYSSDDFPLKVNGKIYTHGGRTNSSAIFPHLLTKLEAASLWDMGFIKDEDYWKNHPDKIKKKDVFEELIKIQENAGFVDCVIIDALLELKERIEKK